MWTYSWAVCSSQPCGRPFCLSHQLSQGGSFAGSLELASRLHLCSPSPCAGHSGSLASPHKFYNQLIDTLEITCQKQNLNDCSPSFLSFLEDFILDQQYWIHFLYINLLEISRAVWSFSWWEGLNYSIYFLSII